MSKRRHDSAEDKESTPTHWDRVAQWYDELVGEAGGEYHREVVIPAVLRMLAAEPGEKVLDVACGQGVLCRILHRAGVQATGVDAARELVRLARQRSDAEITYHIADARDLAVLPAEHYNAAACVLSLQNINPIRPLCETVAQRLIKGGRFVILMMHPCFRGHHATSWGWDDKSKVQYRRVDRYLLPRKEPIVAHPGQKSSEYTWSFHRPMQAYVKALRQAGMLVDAMEELPSHKQSEPGPRASAENTARKEIPMFMGIRAVKI